MAVVCGIVLAAGLSSRMGRPKQTLPFGDTTLLGWVVRNVEESSLDRVIVVLGGGGEQAQSALPAKRAVVVFNNDSSSGSAASLQIGLNAVGDCSAVMLLLGDMPEVDRHVIDQVRDDWERHEHWAVVTSYRGHVAHPFVISAELFPELRGLHGDKALWRVLSLQSRRVHRLHVDRCAPLDVDTWEDYVSACRRLHQPAENPPLSG